ncbi:MAG: hypothetical protein DRR19_08140 [Candidatus Parabeggiatoa sp. nov. 1]|nr:MAG: hypothetical protein DRR19_08140 [Gammaproteobacteria bacterium]
MFNWFNNIKIRNKLIWAFLVMIGLTTIVSLVALISQQYTQATVTELLDVDGKIAKLGRQSHSDLLMAQRNEKDYLLHYKPLGFEKARTQYVNKVQAHIATIHKYMAKIRELEDEEEHIAATKTIDQAVAEYETTFLKVVDLLEKRGFKNSGLDGQLRENVHAIEEAINAQNLNPLTIDMLMMRRHEKDYLLRTEEKYIRRLHETVTQFKKNVAATDLDSTEKEQLTTLATQYQAQFDQLVQMDTQIAASINTYRATVHRLESLLTQMQTTAQLHEDRTYTNIQRVVQTTRLIVIGASLVAVVVGLWIAVFLAGLISKPLTLIVQGAKLLTAGDTALTGIDQTEIGKITTRQDEMGNIGRAFEDLAHYFKTVIEDMVQVSQGLAVGKLNITPQSEYRGDFIQIKQALETALSNQRLVIEDIVQVSQGLAAGNLSITPQSEYQGDFVQIKQALETVLSNQRIVIEDIVQVSQGLAAGNLSVTPQSEYQGDFVQIKQALETALLNQRLVIEDIVKVSQGLAEGNLSIAPQSEYQGDFAQIKNAQETVLSNQRQVIEDIVQVSQGLAGGNLHIKSQAYYQGDYVQIKEALETALSNLRLVLDDIVQVSQGLAEGNLEVTPNAEYHGDFLQIQNALKTAAVKLAAATKQTDAQDWLKTGQNQLNEQMSGEQSIVELTHNIVSFLTLYLEARVGVCYLIEESSEHRRFSVSASYAYARGKNLADEFEFSEGLVERAAKEQQSILLTINAGLGEEIPRNLIVSPFFYENAIKGVIVIGSVAALTEIQLEFFNQVMPNIGIAVNSIESHAKMQKLLQQTQEQATELQSQKDVLQNQKEELQHQKEELQSQSEELQSQAEELQSQTEELRHTNDELEERTRELERQREDIRQKNQALEQSQKAIEIKAEELEIASQYKSEFLANMSHELRTPLNSLLILSQLLADNKPGNLTDKQVEYARTVNSAGADLLTLINDILDLSKVEAGKMEINLENVSLAALVENLEQKFRHVAQDKGLGFQITLTDVERANTDGQRLKQIINNLLSNAFKFTREGEVKLTIQRGTDKTLLSQGGTGRDLSSIKLVPAKTIAISVIDTGIGIPADKQKVIFEAFQQVDGTTSRRFGGTGLGLSISRQLARLLGGEIQLLSEEGKGSTFTLYLPETLSVPAKASTQIPPKTPLPTGGASTVIEIMTNAGGNVFTPQSTTYVAPLGGKPGSEPEIADDRANLQPTDKSLLIIEDDRKFSRLLMEIARENHFKCLIAEDGKTGLQLAEQYQPNAIILDVGLPLLDGWMVMEKLKDNPETRHIPVHFMSASEQSMDAKKMGAIGYLLKPINMEQLGNAFQKIELFITKTVKTLLIVVDNKIHQQQILDLVGSENIQITQAITKAAALEHLLQETQFDCMILDMDIEQSSGIQLVEQMNQREGLCHIPLIVYAERELTPNEETLLLQCNDQLTVKTVRTPERLLDEATLFLHQLEANLPVEKRKMLRMVHDKVAILRNKKVLITDDDVRNTFALTTVLEDSDMEVIVANNGKEALEMLEEHADIAIVLMDIMMPEMDGYEAMQQIRKQPSFRKLPIIALTAKAMKGDKAKCLESGANDYISKPVDTDKLISLMRVWLYR